MTDMQKLWILYLSTALGSVVAVGAVYLITDSWALAMAGFAVLALPALGRRLIGPLTADERDTAITHRAVELGYHLFWVVFILSFVVAATVPSLRTATIRMEQLIVVPWLAWVVTIVSRSGIALWLYARGC